MLVEPLYALLVLRSKLDTYLKAKNKVLFWCLAGEKQFGDHPHVLIARLTGAAAYKVGEEVDGMQPLRNEPSAPSRVRVKLEKKDFPSISEKLLNQMNEMYEKEFDEDDKLRGGVLKAVI